MSAERQRQPVLPGPHPVECTCEHCGRPDIVQIQGEVWERISEEEWRGERQPPIVKW